MTESFQKGSEDCVGWGLGTYFYSLSVLGLGGGLRCSKTKGKRKLEAGPSKTLGLGPAQRKELGRMLSSGI